MSVQTDYYIPELDAVRRERDKLRTVILNIQALAEKGAPIDCAKLATRCRLALSDT